MGQLCYRGVRNTGEFNMDDWKIETTKDGAEKEFTLEERAVESDYSPLLELPLPPLNENDLDARISLKLHKIQFIDFPVSEKENQKFN